MFYTLSAFMITNFLFAVKCQECKTPPFERWDDVINAKVEIQDANCMSHLHFLLLLYLRFTKNL